MNCLNAIYSHLCEHFANGDVLLTNIRAERDGNWSMHLRTSSRMLPNFFVANRIVTVCVFVCHLFSFYPFYFDFHSARIIFDVSSGFYLWNINKTTA